MMGERPHPDPATARPCRLLAFAPNTWEGQWMNRQQLLSRLARVHEIVYTNGLWSVWARGKPDFETSPLLGDFEQHDGVWVDRAPKLLLRWPAHPMWDNIAVRLAVTRWRRRLATLGTGPLISYVFHPMYARYAERVGADMLVYHPYDLFSQTPDWTAENGAEESRLLARCSLAITSSEPSREALQRRTDRPVFCVPNGVDAEFFVKGPDQAAPEDIARIPRPRIGYVGSLNRKVDFALVAKLASMEPSWQLVLIGPDGSLDDASRASIEACRRLPNIHFLGSKAMHELPAYMGALDVGVMCYRQDTWMDYGYPLKLHEYLAVGLPVVSTALPSIRDYDPWIEIASDAQSWRDAIARSLNGQVRGNRAERQAVARRNTWDLRVATLQQILGSALDQSVATASLQQSPAV